MKKATFLTLSLLLGFSFPVNASQPVALVELFTSQGCSSCPPADAFLGKLAMRPDVLALAYHVDYWDYIGWKDVHAKAAFTQRQRDYAHSFNLRYVYTPQMVVSGRYQESGNQQDRILKAITRELANQTDITLEYKSDGLSLSGPKQESPLNAYLINYLKENTTEVRRGENRGRSLTNYHIVQSLQKVGSWSGGQSHFDLSDQKTKNIGQGFFLQHPETLEIVAAFKLD
ncbi:DUF1223 domain-containing protein [Terasakiella sp.]|uniref:DUF1223 domain-containing protein n=1 Tax=Terasakiella sp. TaxID=2034861 RepID=UPI003AA8CFB2